jgi:hypothetical protein
MLKELAALLLQGDRHHGLLLAHAYIRRCEFYFDNGLNCTMPEQGNRCHGHYSQTQVIQDALSMLRASFIKMHAWDIVEQVRQVPTRALTPTPSPTTIPTTDITHAIVTPSPTVTNYNNANNMAT